MSQISGVTWSSTSAAYRTWTSTSWCVTWWKWRPSHTTARGPTSVKCLAIAMLVLKARIKAAFPWRRCRGDRTLPSFVWLSLSWPRCSTSGNNVDVTRGGKSEPTFGTCAVLKFSDYCRIRRVTMTTESNANTCPLYAHQQGWKKFRVKIVFGLRF